MRDHGWGAAATVAVAVVWWMLALWRPTVTYHLAPVFAGGVWPVVLRRGAPLRVSARDARLGAMAGAFVAVGTSILLWWSDLLRGPTLWGDGGAILEAVLAVALGAFGGYRLARCGPGW